MGGSGGTIGAIFSDKSLKEFAESREIEIDKNRSIYLDEGRPYEFLEIYKREPFEDVDEFLDYAESVIYNAKDIFNYSMVDLKIIFSNPEHIKERNFKAYFEFQKGPFSKKQESLANIDINSQGSVKMFYNIKNWNGLNKKELVKRTKNLSLESKIILGESALRS